MGPVIIYTENIEVLRALILNLKPYFESNLSSFIRVHLLPESRPEKEDGFISDVYNYRHLNHLVLTTKYEYYVKQFDISGIKIRSPDQKKAKLIFAPGNTIFFFVHLGKIKNIQDLIFFETHHQISKVFLPRNSTLYKPEILLGVGQVLIPSTPLKSILAFNTCSLWYFMEYITYRMFIPKVEAIDRRDTGPPPSPETLTRSSTPT